MASPAPLRRVALRHPRDAFGGLAAIAASWQALGYSGAPNFARACALPMLPSTIPPGATMAASRR